MNELEHYGTKGQKWGIRRFQYEDGSLTPEGKARYRKKFERDFDRRLNRAAKRTEKGKLDVYTRQSINMFNSAREGKADGEIAAAAYTRQLERAIRDYSVGMVPTAIMASGVRAQKDIMISYGRIPIELASLTPIRNKTFRELENIGYELARNKNEKRDFDLAVAMEKNQNSTRVLSDYAHKLGMTPEEVTRVYSTMSSLDKQLKNVFDTSRQEYLDKKGPSVAKLPTPGMH